MKVIAVSQRVDAYPERRETRDALDQQLAAWLGQAGCLAVPVPNLAPVASWLAAIRPAGIVLSGGNDLGQAPERDAAETALLDHAKAESLPVLGICRGMQMLVHYCGGRLEPVAGHVAARHMLDDGREVNSFHAWGVRHCPPDLRPLAHAADGTIEELAHVSLPWQGWMWHPEREQPFHPTDITRLRALFHRN